MTTVVAIIGSAHFPAIANPQTAEAKPVSGGANGAVIGGVGINPISQGYAGCIGALSINGISIVSNTAGNGLLDLTVWGQKEIVNFINANVPGVQAVITPATRLQLRAPAGVPITIAGSANILTALGLTAGAFNN